MSYKNLGIWKLAREVVYEMSLKLPKFEMYETGVRYGDQAKSSIKYPVSNIQCNCLKYVDL